MLPWLCCAFIIAITGIWGSNESRMPPGHLTSELPSIWIWPVSSCSQKPLIPGQNQKICSVVPSLFASPAQWGALWKELFSVWGTLYYRENHFSCIAQDTVSLWVIWGLFPLCGIFQKGHFSRMRQNIMGLEQAWLNLFCLPTERLKQYRWRKRTRFAPELGNKMM